MANPINGAHWSKKLTSLVFYASLIPQDLFESVMSTCTPDESEQVFDKVLSILDFSLITEVAKRTGAMQAIAFLQQAETEYNNEALLTALAQFDLELPELLKQVLERQLLAIYSGLNKV